MGIRDSRPSLDGKHFDVIVIGGGINGVAIARECAHAGQKVLLLESHDFAAGTTSRSTRIIHGGLRYLEHGEIGLVRESLRERQRLIAERGHLVRPLSFVLAVPANQRGTRSALAIRFGLWLYSRFAGTTARPPATVSDLVTLEKELDRGGSLALFDYEDAQCEFPERLVAEWLAEAIAAGATARNHTEALQVLTSLGRATGVIVRDRFTGNEARVQARWIINATGPWADRVCADSAINTHAPMVGGVRGTHIVLNRPSLVIDSAIYAQAADNRPIFLIPWNGALLVGTTEIRDTGDPGRAEPTSAEIDYLLGALRRFFPRQNMSANDISYAFAGVRPLPFVPEDDPAEVTRRHILHDHRHEGAANMISVIGGKLTTAGAVARDCARAMGLRAVDVSPALVASVPGSGLASHLDQWAQEVGASTGIDSSSARAIAEWYGPHAFEILRLAKRSSYLRSKILEGGSHILAEVAYSVRSECTVTLADILLRRIPVALSCNWTVESTRNAALAVAPLLRWNPCETDAEIEAFEEERARFLRKIASVESQLPELAQAPQRAA